MVKAQVKTGGRGKAGGVKVAKTAEEAEQHAQAILGMDIKGHTVGTVMIAAGARIAEEYYFSLLLDRANRSYLAMCSKEGGMEIEQLAVERPEALARVAVDPNVGIDDAKAREIVEAAGLRRRDRRQDRARPEVAVGRLPRRGRHARRGEPAGEDRGRRDHRPRRQGHPRRERRLPPPGPRRARGQGRGRPARGGRQGEGPQLRQARRLRRHHRQRRRAWSCPPSTSSPTPARSSVARSPPTSSTSVVAPRPRSWPTACTSSSATSR